MKRRLGALEKVDADLTSLQYKVRRDPPSYFEDHLQQYVQYETLRDLLLQNPSTHDDSGIIQLSELIDFVAHTADCYPGSAGEFAQDLVRILTAHHEELQPDLRDKIVVNLVLLRNKDLIDSSILLNTLFPVLVSTSSKSLRALLFQKIVSDLRTSNAKATNHRLNRTVQTVLYNLLTSDRDTVKGLWAVKITRELWKRQIWTDAKAVEIMKEACMSQNEKVMSGGIRFFLGGDKEREAAAEVSSSEDDSIDMNKLRHQAGINKKTKKKGRDLKKAAATVKRRERKKAAPHPLNFSALHLLHDPQTFAEILFSRHVQNSKSKISLDTRLLILQLVSRLVGLHRLTIMPLYSYLQKHLTPRQTSVTTFLAILAQATHDLVPPDALEPLIQKIANEFVSEAAASQVAAAGLNAIREVCARQPLAMNDTLLQDLVMYRKSKDKGVQMASRGLLSLYREVSAGLLKKRDRGKDATVAMLGGVGNERRYGEMAANEIQGIDLLEEWKATEREKRRSAAGLDSEASTDGLDEAEGWKDWDVESDDSSGSGGWINVESDGADIELSDSDDDAGKSRSNPGEPPAKRLKADVGSPRVDDQRSLGMKSEEPAVKPLSKLLTTTLLTPADLKQLKLFQQTSAINAALPASNRAALLAARHADDAITAETIEAAASLGKKYTKDEKIAMAKGDREEKHQSTSARRKEKKIAEGKSTTNREKERKKNFLMTLGKAKGKNKRSLVEMKKTMRGHIERSKRGGRRGNKGH